MAPATPLMLAQMALEQAIAARDALRAANPQVINALIAAEAAADLAEEQSYDENLDSDQDARIQAEWVTFQALAAARKAYVDLFSNVVMDVREAEEALALLQN